MDSNIAAAVRALRSGGVVLHATEGVWGFACDPMNETAVRRVLQIKGRAAAKGLIVIGGNPAHFEDQLNRLTDADRDRVTATWPGRHTWILPQDEYPQWITGGRRTIACRVPGHEQSRSLAEAFGRPIVSTSANRSGEDPVLDECSARREFADEVDLILKGRINGAHGASVIHDLNAGVLRSG